MTRDNDTASARHAPAGRAWIRPVAVVVSSLIIGFVGGWVVRGDNGPVTVLAPPAPQTSGHGAGATTSAGTTTAPGTTTGGATTTAPGTTSGAAQPPPPDRSAIKLAVLNGTGVTGRAGQTASQAESLGYQGVVAGNAPTSTDPSIVYYRAGQQSAAERVARDLEVTQVRALPASGSLATAAPADAQVVLVLGPG